MKPEEKNLLLAIACGDLGDGGIKAHDRARLLVAAALEDLGYVTIQEAKGLYGLTVAKCEVTSAGAQWLLASEFRYLLPKDFVEARAVAERNVPVGTLADTAVAITGIVATGKGLE